MDTVFHPFNNPHLRHVKNDLCVDVVHPSICPICARSLSPDILSAHYFQPAESKSKRGVCLYLCTSCCETFLGSYQIEFNGYSMEATLIEVAPHAFSASRFSDEINSLSPDFVRIYNQAEEAESRNLFDLCGLGYRKALECLVKDYLCHVSPNESSAIKKTKLAECIAMLGDQQLRDLAATASWLGNDFAHYERRHTHLDMEDLKRFILSTGFWISHSLTARQAAQLRSRPADQPHK